MENDGVTGIVLAGGKSSRMGTDKSLLLFREKPLVSHVIDALKPLCKEVIISSNKLVYDFTGCKVIPDEFDIQAPMVGIYSCLKHSNTSRNIVISCDMPLITTEVLNYLLEFYTENGVTVPVHDHFMEPLCGIYDRSIALNVSGFISNNELSLHRFIRNIPHTLVEINKKQFSYSIFNNVNTLTDYENLNNNLY